MVALLPVINDEQAQRDVCAFAVQHGHETWLYGGVAGSLGVNLPSFDHGPVLTGREQ